MNFKDEGCREPTDHPQPSPSGRKTGQTLDPTRQSKNLNEWVEVEVVNLEE